MFNLVLDVQYLVLIYQNTKYKMEDIFIYKSNGQPLGFIRNGNLYSTYGQYLGWQDVKHIWNAAGYYAGTLTNTNGNSYILKYIFGAAPIPQTPRSVANLPPQDLPALPPTISAIQLHPSYKDGF